MLDIGLGERADWIANGVLYAPVGLLTTFVLNRRWNLSLSISAALALLLGAGLAVGIEFAQLFFPPRTVSINDLLAEVLGCVLGAVLAVVLIRGGGEALLVRLQGARRRQLEALWPLGVVVLLTASLFPFDVLISSEEIFSKVRGPFWGWWRAPLFADDGWALTLTRLLAEALVVAPLGALWGRQRLSDPVLPSVEGLVGRGLLIGLALGFALEVCQWFMASGVSQGISVFSRGLGWVGGALLGVLVAAWTTTEWRTSIRRLTVPVLMLCLAVALAKAGWWGGPWRSVDEALFRVFGGEIRFLPLYYHYYTSEGAAVQSVVPVLLLFAPLGVLCWAWRRSAWWGAGLAALVALVAETGRLLAVDGRPDPSNVWIAAMSAFVAAWLTHQLFAVNGLEVGGRPQAFEVPERRRQPPLAASARGSSRVRNTDGGGVLLMVSVGVLALVWLWRFPVFQPAVGLMLIGAAVFVWWRPVSLLAVAMATLPLLNLSIWSGREFVDEFDVLLVVILAVAWMRRAPAIGPLQTDRVLNWTLGLVALSLVISTLSGWAPWEVAALQNPHSPLSPWYTLRLFKGAVLAALLGWVAHRQIAAGEPVVQALGVGMVIGLGGVLAFVVWERLVFAGLLNFASDYRVAGPVLAMRLGGAYLDAYLVTSLPFALVGALYSRNWVWRSACAAVALGAAYAMAVTFTRSTYLAVAVAVLVVSVGVLRPSPKLGHVRVWKSAGLISLLVLAAYPIITGPFASARMALVSQDFATRMQHVRHVIGIRDGGLINTAFGQGLGRFPSQNYWAKQVLEGGGVRSMAAHRFLQVGGVGQLQLAPGYLLFLDQAIDLPQQGSVKVVLRGRATAPRGGLTVLICHKWLLASGTCVSNRFSLAGLDQGWQELSAELNTGPLGADSGWFQRPVRLSLFNDSKVRVDLDSISVLDARGRDLVRNGTFDAGSDHWSYTSDDHLAWHVKNMLLAIWFDLGWVGVFAFGTLVIVSLLRSGVAAWSGNRSAQALLGACAGLMIVALFDSVVDEPRFLLLLLVLAWLGSKVGSGRPRLKPKHHAFVESDEGS